MLVYFTRIEIPTGYNSSYKLIYVILKWNKKINLNIFCSFFCCISELECISSEFWNAIGILLVFCVILYLYLYLHWQHQVPGAVGQVCPACRVTMWTALRVPPRAGGLQPHSLPCWVLSSSGIASGKTPGRNTPVSIPQLSPKPVPQPCLNDGPYGSRCHQGRVQSLEHAQDGHGQTPAPLLVPATSRSEYFSSVCDCLPDAVWGHWSLCSSAGHSGGSRKVPAALSSHLPLPPPADIDDSPASLLVLVMDLIKEVLTQSSLRQHKSSPPTRGKAQI